MEDAATTMDTLNDDILRLIFNHLHFDDKIRLRRVNSRWFHLLGEQLLNIKALRLGQFHSGAYNITSGLAMKTCSHYNSTGNLGRNNFDQKSACGTIFNKKLCRFPAELETLCYQIDQFDYLYRCFKFSSESIVILSLGQLNISYRLLMVIAHNLPKLEHLEIINCSSILTNSNDKSVNNGHHQALRQHNFRRPISGKENSIPSIESFNNSRAQLNQRDLYSNLIFNQNPDEQVNVQERLIRSTLVKSCQLIQESKTENYLPNLQHLLIKDCNLLNEFSLSLILALTQQSLVHLSIESNQYLTGEFLNYCGPNLKVLRIKFCPQLQLRFLEDLVKLKQLLSPTKTIDKSHDNNDINSENFSFNNNRLPTSTRTHPLPQPISPSMFKNHANFNPDIYCTL